MSFMNADTVIKEIVVILNKPSDENMLRGQVFPGWEGELRENIGKSTSDLRNESFVKVTD